MGIYLAPGIAHGLAGNDAAAQPFVEKTGRITIEYPENAGCMAALDQAEEQRQEQLPPDTLTLLVGLDVDAENLSGVRQAGPALDTATAKAENLVAGVYQKADRCRVDISTSTESGSIPA